MREEIARTKPRRQRCIVCRQATLLGPVAGDQKEWREVKRHRFVNPWPLPLAQKLLHSTAVFDSALCLIADPRPGLSACLMTDWLRAAQRKNIRELGFLWNQPYYAAVSEKERAEKTTPLQSEHKLSHLAPSSVLTGRSPVQDISSHRGNSLWWLCCRREGGVWGRQGSHGAGFKLKTTSGLSFLVFFSFGYSILISCSFGVCVCVQTSSLHMPNSKSCVPKISDSLPGHVWQILAMFSNFH